MIDRILLPTDGSDCALMATDHAAAFADAYDATVHVLTVVEAIADDVTDAQRQRASTQLVDPTVEDLGVAGVETTSRVADGVPVEEILATADELDVDLIAIGTHGRSGLRRHLLGSVSERVLRSSDVPVLAVPQADDAGGSLPYADVLVPTDGSEGAEVARPLAVDLTGAFDAKLHGLSVVDTRAAWGDVQTSVLVEQFREVAEEAIEDLATAAADAGLERVETDIRRGIPHEAIDAYVTSAGVDLVVMGTHGRSGLDRYLLGSVTENLLRTTDVPILAVRAPEPAE